MQNFERSSYPPIAEYAFISDCEVGTLVAPSLGPTRTEADFVRHIAQTVATDPEASWVFVVDNLNIHASASLVRFVAQACGLTAALGKKQNRRTPESTDASRVLVMPKPSHPLRVPAQTQLLAQPD